MKKTIEKLGSEHDFYELMNGPIQDKEPKLNTTNFVFVMLAVAICLGAIIIGII